MSKTDERDSRRALEAGQATTSGRWFNDHLSIDADRRRLRIGRVLMTQSAFATAAILTVTFLTLFALERLVPLRVPRARLATRLLVNLGLSALAIGTAYVVIAPAVRMSLQQTWAARIGLLQWAALPPAAEFTLGFLLLDLSFYYWHLANHKIPFLWRFHNVHHIDPDLDVSTAFRFHFGEVALSVGLRVGQVLLLGVSPLTFAAYEVVFEMNTLLHHSNVRLPLALERLLNKVLVTPRMHGIHHSAVQREDNSNFSVVFSWWDRIHHSLRLNIPQSRIVIGIPGYLEPEANRIGRALILPFVEQRDYWQTTEGKRIERSESEIVVPPTVMAG
jgi:sterol desaturase/sphingolipid hydroxylase (fatty acid hydroxylase superfamily)